jgi:hypothetical protein
VRVVRAVRETRLEFAVCTLKWVFFEAQETTVTEQSYQMVKNNVTFMSAKS